MSAEPDVSDPEALVGKVVAQRYRIEALLGVGGMGAVYSAEHVYMHKVVALKILHRAMTASSEVVKRFEREAMAAARIAHPNVVSATDFGKLDDGSFYLVLEYVQGKTLAKLLKEAGALPIERALPIARQIADALAAAHAAGIVHRDLKPDNVMLVDKGDSRDFVKVLDFGIAKVPIHDHVGTQLTQMGSVFGTPQYMAPEQASGVAVDQRADLYALGLILHEMLTGHAVFDSNDMVVLLTMQLTAPAPPLPESMPKPLRELVAELLQKSPDQRPASAAEVVQRIDVCTSRPRASAITHGAVASQPVVTSWKDRAIPLATNAWSVVRERSQRRVRGVPVWAFGIGALAIVVGLSFWLGSGDDRKQAGVDEHRLENAEPRESEADKDKNANRPALAKDELSDTSARESLALAQTHLRAARRRDGAARLNDALSVYEEVLDRNPALSADRTMLEGLRFYAAKDSTAELVLDFAAKHMGKDGADLIFDVWQMTSLKTVATQKAGELLESSAVKRNMSPALSLALELRKSLSCEEIKELLPRIESDADRRSVLPLRALAKTSGCGDNGKEDCYPCLREGTAFRDALLQAEIRKTPRFEARNWR